MVEVNRELLEWIDTLLGGIHDHEDVSEQTRGQITETQEKIRRGLRNAKNVPYVTVTGSTNSPLDWWKTDG